MDKKQCSSCGKPKCSCKNKDFTKAVIEIDNQEQITLMRKVVIPTSMGDDTTVPPAVGKYKNVLLYYEANHKSYLYSSDGIPTLLANGLTDYEEAVNLPQINGVTLIGNKTLNEIGINAYHFDTVADMKASTDLANGNYARTLGYYSKDDKGGAYYKISSTAPSGYYETLTSGLYAELILEDVMNVKQFGAKGDGITDDTLSIQTALDFNSNIQIPDGVYMVDAVTELRPNNGNKIELSKNAKLKAITNDSTHYRIFHILDTSNVEISGGTLEGDRLTHTGATGEWGNCIRVFGECTDIFIHDINLINPWGDGISVAITGSARTERLHIKNARRNGISLGGATEFVSTDDFIEDTNGTNPQCGVDIEPDHGYNLLRNVVFNNLNCKNNAANGLIFGLSKDNTGYPSNIQINNYKSEGDNRGIWIEPGEKNIGVIEINNPYINNSKSSALFIRLHSILHKISINNPTINGYGVTAANSAGIEIQSTADVECGNLDIVHPIVKNKNPDSNNSRAVYFNGSSTKFRNITVLDPIDLDGNNVAFNTADNKNIRIIDGNDILIDETDSNLVIGADTKFGVNSINYTSNHTVRVSGISQFPIGQILKFMNYGDYEMSIYFQNQHIYGITNDLDKTVTTAEKGAYLEVKRINSADWGVISKSGTFTTN